MYGNAVRQISIWMSLGVHVEPPFNGILMVIAVLYFEAPNDMFDTINGVLSGIAHASAPNVL